MLSIFGYIDNHPQDAAYRAAAERIHADEGEIEIDDGAVVSKGEDAGAYVAAWVWVPDDVLEG